MVTNKGGNVKLARQSKSSVQPPASVGDGGEEAGPGATMGLLKRKWTTPPDSPAPSKRRTLEEAELRISSNSEPVEGGTHSKIQAGRSFTPSQDAAATRVKQSSGQSNNESTVSELAPEEAARLRFEKDVDALQSRTPSFVENMSHGQGTSSSQAGPPPETSGPAVALTKDCEAQSPATPHLVPSHAGWFQWAKVHQLEKLALPEFFSTKEDTTKTPETYMEHRSFIMKKYRENPQKLMKFEDVRELLTGDVSGSVRLFGFLDHWGLINYQAITDFPPSSSSRGLVGSAEDTNNGAVALSPLVKPALANLFNFEAALVPAHKQVSIGPSPASNLPISSLAEAAVQESLAAPAVEYHCNSCQADCSKRRYHCQKQADFDLCPDCYSDGKFGQGMTGTDFLRMDALTGNADVNGGGWSDQETLLLLEALELYGDNWNEIAEHVATKSKAQCILHFIRLPIEDPFLEDMESSNSVVTVQPPGTVASNKQTTSPPTDKDAQAKAAQDENPSSSESMETVLSNAEPQQDPSGPKEIAKKDGETSSPPEAEEKEKETDVSDISEAIKKENECKDVHPLLAIAESAGCAGPDGLIAFVDAGNPVMTQVAFLAAMVGPRIAAAAAQAALKSLAEDDPVGFLSAKNSFALDGSDNSDKTLASALPESGHQEIETQLVSFTGLATVSSDEKSTSKPTAEPTTKENANEKVPAGILEKPSGQEAPPSQKSQVKAPTNSQIVAEQDVPSVAKVRTAAANALASAAVKAKLLADQEEREIQRLVAGVIENQLKKLELKLKHFSELESMLGKECEQAEKARAKVYAERARIVASRLGSPPSTTQLQSTASTAASYPKTSAHPTNSVAQSKPASFNFGPAAVSAPAAAAASMTTSALESSSSLPTSSSSQQGVTPQRLPRPVPGTGLASGAKE